MPLLKSRASAPDGEHKNSQGEDDLRRDQNRSARKLRRRQPRAIFVELRACLTRLP